MQTTIDGLLNRRVTLEQPTDGYRVAVDTILLAAAVPALEGEKILDMGCGVGGAMLCLACRTPAIIATGIEIKDEFIALCRNNIARNAFASGLSVLPSDTTKLPAALSGTFDHVMMNPPYHDEARHDVSAQILRRAANTEKEGDLAMWIENAAKALKPSGIMTVIHRADRLEEILGLMRGLFGLVEILPILPKAGALSKRVVIRAHKTGVFRMQFCQSFILHETDGRYTEAAEGILRHMNGLEFVYE